MRKIEIAKIKESFTLLANMTEKWVPDELQSSRKEFGPLSDLEDVHAAVLGGPELALTFPNGPPNFP